MSRKKRLFGILLALPPLLLGLLYGGGYIAQFMRNYHEWQAAGGTPGNGTSPTVPSFAVSECLRAIFTMPYGVVGILVCVGALALLIVMVMRMGYSETGEYDKDRNFIYSKKGTYGTSGFMSEKEAEEIFDLRTSLKNHNGTIFGLLNGRYVCMPEESMLNKNVAVYGASGSMKTRAYCINRILQATVSGKDGKMESLIICDPKSELYEKTSELLRKTHTVKVFNLVCPENSDSWNCLAEIEGDELMAQRFCDVIIKNTGSERGDHFWDSAEMNLLKALVLYVEQGYPPERKNIGQVYRLLTHCDEKELNSLFNMLPSSHPAKAPYAIFQQASDTVRSGVIIGLGSRLQVFQNIPYAVTKQIFRRDKRSSDEQKIMLLANQAILSTAEMIKCAEQNTFAFGSEDELIDTLYHDEYTTSENISHSVRFLPQCRPVITSVANLYLRKQIIFERM